MKRLMWAVLFLVVLWSLTPLWVPRFAEWIARPAQSNIQDIGELREQKADLSPAGQFGDMFGSVNALFSGLAFIGVAYGLFLQTEHKRREKQPEVFARLAASPEERPVVLARKEDTPAGKVQLTLQVPVYVEAGLSAMAFNVDVHAAHLGANVTHRLPMPVFTGSKRDTPILLDLTIEAGALAPTILTWKTSASRGLGHLDLSIEFENQQQARWRVKARYALAVGAEADAELLENWVNKAAAASPIAEPIELGTTAVAWNAEDA